MDPQGGGLVKEAALPAAARIELDKARHSRCYAAMTAAFEMSKPLSEKYRALIQGYAMRDAQKGDAFKKLLATLDQKEIELECFEARHPLACLCAAFGAAVRAIVASVTVSTSACLRCPWSRRCAVWRGKRWMWESSTTERWGRSTVTLTAGRVGG